MEVDEGKSFKIILRRRDIVIEDIPRGLIKRSDKPSCLNPRNPFKMD
jgi:hypothetical protein